METENIEEEIDGSIHSIHVQNFFCHDNLEIKFNRNTNFIVGRNGSGKSALLTALVVGLGARASATDRGNNLLCKSSLSAYFIKLFVYLLRNLFTPINEIVQNRNSS